MAINNTVENINNQPTIEPQTVTGAFLRYIAKTIPLAFDESMSYYECICALRDYINQFIDNLNNVNDGLSELQTFYLELQDYVNTYFDNLDVQEEINNKLDEMASDGTLSQLIAAYVQPRIDEQNEVISQINDKVNSFVNFTPNVVTSTDDMTDTNKIYILSTDGYWYYYNGTSWVAGAVYQGITVPDNSITPIKLKGHTILNLLDFDDVDVLTGYGIVQLSETSVRYDQVQATLSVSGYIPVEPGQVIYSTCEMPSNYQAIVYFDSSKNVIGCERVSRMWTALKEKTIPSNCYYIRIGYNYNNRGNAIYTTDANNLPSSYIPYGKFSIDGLYVEKEDTTKYINIYANGTGDYPTLRAALEATNPNDVYVINIYPGTYNVTDYYTTEELQNAYYDPSNIRGSFCGMYVDGNITLRGMGGRDQTIIKCSLPTSIPVQTREQISTLNLQGNINLENLTIIGQRTRYAIHDDFNGNNNKTINIKNCIIKDLNGAGGISSTSHAYGMGTKSGKTTNAIDSIFMPRFYLHTNKNFTKPSVTNLTNCYVSENISIEDMNSGVTDLINIKDCVAPFIEYSYYPNTTTGTCEVYCNNNIPYIHKNDNYYLTSDISQIINTSGSTISKGSLIKKKNVSFETQLTGTNFEVITNDDSSMFYGIAIDNIADSFSGRVQTKGYVKASDIGLNATVGTKYKISNGSLITTTDNDYIAVCNMLGYIYIV